LLPLTTNAKGDPPRQKKIVVNMYISRARESNYIVLIKRVLGITFIFSSLVFSWMYGLLGDVNMP
jgi:hypothetical protein